MAICPGWEPHSVRSSQLHRNPLSGQWPARRVQTSCAICERGLRAAALIFL